MARVTDSKRYRLCVQFSLEENKYFVCPFLRSGVEAKDALNSALNVSRVQWNGNILTLGSQVPFAYTPMCGIQREAINF